MPFPRFVLRVAALVAVCLLSAGCGGDAAALPDEGPLPVTVIRLEPVDLQKTRMYTGSVEAWNQEDLSFEVGGRVVETVDAGERVIGPVRKRTGEGIVEEPGTFLAAIDTEEYVNNRASAVANVAQVTGTIASVSASIMAIKQQQLAAKGELDRSSANEKRVQELFRRKAASKAELDQAVATLITAQASVGELESTRLSRESDLLAAQSQLQGAGSELKQAERDLKNCRISAPFPGEISQVHIVNGAIASPGAKVMTLVMMNPVKVEINVAAGVDSAIPVGSLVKIRKAREASEEARGVTITGRVYQKATVADPATRTFRISMLVKNRRIETPPDLPESLQRIRDYRSLLNMEANGQERFFVEQQALHGPAGQEHVWVVEGVDAKNLDRSFFGTPYQLRKVTVTRGEFEVTLPLQKMGVELTDLSGLGVNDVLAVGVPDDHEEDRKIVFARETWAFRPGDTVRVELDRGGTQPGLWLPVTAVVRDTGTQRDRVFVVDESGAASPVEITIAESTRQYVRVEELTPGDEVVVRGAHLLQPTGGKVRIVAVEPAPGQPATGNGEGDS